MWFLRGWRVGETACRRIGVWGTEVQSWWGEAPERPIFVNKPPADSGDIVGEAYSLPSRAQRYAAESRPGLVDRVLGWLTVGSARPPIGLIRDNRGQREAPCETFESSPEPRPTNVGLRSPFRPIAGAPFRPFANTPTRPHAHTPTRPHAHTPTRPHAHTPPLPFRIFFYKIAAARLVKCH